MRGRQDPVGVRARLVGAGTALFAFLICNVGATTLDGLYHGSINGVQSSLQLSTAADQLSGEIDAGGYRYTLQGRVSGSSAEGLFSDPASGGSGNFRALKDNNGIRLELEINGQPIVLWFGGEPSTPQPPSTATAQGQAGDLQRDPTLIGRWRHSESMTSGEFTGVVQTMMTIFPDGRYSYGEGQFAGGGPGVSGSTAGGDTAVGEWRTQDSIVYIREPGRPDWTPFARYYVEGTQLLFTFGDGSRQVWSRAH